MALRLDPLARPRDMHGLSRALRARLAAYAPHASARRRLGVEHEYAVFEGDRQIDFRDLVRGLGVEAHALHPTNPHMLLTASGLALMADGVVAETASPPETLRPGFAMALDAWTVSGRTLLDASLPPSLHLFPGSTHISVETPPARTEQICLWFAQTFAPALMLLMDNADSPGALVRPRPGRFEFGGEFIDGVRLRAAATFAAGAVLALEQARHLPSAVQVTLEPARQRYGWYIDRTAFGPDLYRDGRAALLHLTTGETVTAQQHLEACWAIAREALGGFADAADIAAVERMIGGDIPLPCEDATWREPVSVSPPPPNPYAQLTHSRRDITIEAVTATWDFVAFRIARTSRTGESHEVVVNIPEAHLGAFTALTAAGRLDDMFVRALAAPLLATLESHSQTLNAAFFAAIVPSDALLPRDRVGVGPGPVSAVRLGKVETPPPPPPPPPPPHRDPTRTGGFPWVWIAAAVGCVFLIGGVLTVLGGDDLVDPTPVATAAPPSATATTGVAPQPPVVGPIRAVLTVPVTTYTVEASSPAGRTLTYRWSLTADPGQECGRKTPSSNALAPSPSATWSHDNAPPDNCHHNAPDHPFTVTVEVSDGLNPAIRRTYRGSNTGTGPAQ